MNEIQNENNRSDDKKRISADIKRYLIPVLGVSLAAVTLCGIGYLYFSPAPAEKVTVAVNDLTDDGAEKSRRRKPINRKSLLPRKSRRWSRPRRLKQLKPIIHVLKFRRPLSRPPARNRSPRLPLPNRRFSLSRKQRLNPPSGRRQPRLNRKKQARAFTFRPVRSVHWPTPNGRSKCLPITTFVQSSKPAISAAKPGTAFSSAPTPPKTKPTASNRPFRPSKVLKRQ